MNDVTGYRHLLRVRLGANGPRGKLLRCTKKDNSGTYWKVKLDTGEWVWPADLHVDGKGSLTAVCRDCGLPFITETVGEPLCYRCAEEAFGTSQRAQEPQDYDGLRHRGPARRAVS